MASSLDQAFSVPYNANLTSWNIGGIARIINVWEGILFFNFCNGKSFINKMLFVEIFFMI